MLSRFILLLFLFSFFSACQLLPAKPDITPPVFIQESKTQFDNLLAFATEIIDMDRDTQIKTCKSVENEAAHQNTINSNLRLCFAFMFAPACKAQHRAKKILAKSLREVNDPQIKQTLTALSFLLNQKLEVAESERKVNNEYTWLSKKTKQLRKELKHSQAELEGIQLKLEQLIEMEQTLHQR